MASEIGASDPSASSTTTDTAGVVPSSGNNSAKASQILAAVRVFPPHNNEMKPLWRYVEVLEKTGKGQGGNTKSRFIISILFLYYHTMKYGRFELVWNIFIYIIYIFAYPRISVFGKMMYRSIDVSRIHIRIQVSG